MATVSENLRISLADNGRRMTLQEFLDAEEEEGYRYELAREVLEVSHIAGYPQRLIVWFLLRLIADYDRANPGRIIYAGGGSEFRLWIPEMISGRHPDVGIATSGAPSDELQKGPRPTLCIEVVSDGREARHRDYVAKREEYLVYGLSEYWIVDRFARLVTVLTRRDDCWEETVFEAEATAHGFLLDGFALSLVELWAVIAGIEGDQTNGVEA